MIPQPIERLLYLIIRYKTVYIPAAKTICRCNPTRFREYSLSTGWGRGRKYFRDNAQIFFYPPPWGCRKFLTHPRGGLKKFLTPHPKAFQIAFRSQNNTCVGAHFQFIEPILMRKQVGNICMWLYDMWAKCNFLDSIVDFDYFLGENRRFKAVL